MTLPTHQLIIFGAQGSGKGTQAGLLAERLNLTYLNTGSLFRAMAAADTPTGRELHERLAAGHLVPDDVTNDVIFEAIEALPAGYGFILDGYPRTIAQADALHGLLLKLDRSEPRPIFLQLEVPRDVLLERLRKRREIEGRHDDTEAGIAKRLEIYDAETEPLLERVTEWADVIAINGDQPVRAVTDEIMEKLDARA